MRFRMFIVAVFALFLAASGLLGQEYRGWLSGRVLDPTGAAVPGAHVALTNTATNVRLTTDTNAEGSYTILYLQPGTYSLRAEGQGFKAFERSPIEVRIDSAVVVDAQLEIGSGKETVTVQATSPLLDLASASQGQTIDAKRVEELPIQQGVPFHLMALTPGLVRTGTNMLDENPYDGTIVAYSLAGASSGNNIITVDGATTGGFSGGTSPSWSPPMESVGEFRVMTNSYDAAQGFTNGANVSVSLKSGTNTLHGAVGDYGGGNGSLIANQYLSVVGGKGKAPSGPYFRREVGVGGPAYIPHVYDGRNKTFWFFGYEWMHRTQVLTQTLTVPSVLERSGDFSALLNLGANYQIYDPYSRQAAANGRVSSSPLPGNIIPSSLFNKTADSKIGVNLLQFWPLPNNVGGLNYAQDGTNNFYCNQSGQSNQYWAMDLRLDHNFSDRHRVYGSMHRSDRDNQDYNIFQNDVSGDSWKLHPRGGVIDDVFVIDKTFIVDARMGFDSFDKLVTSLGPKVLNFRYADYGFPAYMDGLIPSNIERMPSFSPSGYQGAPPGANLQFFVSETFEPSVHFAKTHNSHTMNFGWDWLVRRDNKFTPGLAASGSYNFNGSWMVGPLDNSPSAPIGQGLAQMEYGLPYSQSITRTPDAAIQSTSHALYFQDDWRVSRRLTLNLGIRYEYWGPTTERYNRSTAGWDPNAAQPFASAVQAAYLLHPTPEVPTLPVQGGLLFAGAANGGSHGLWKANSKDFMPRIGLSYALNDKTVIHAGYGIFFGPGGDEYRSVNQEGFSRTTTNNASLDNGLTYTMPLSNPFPTGVLAPFGASLGVQTDVGSSITVIPPSPAQLYVQRYSFGIQRQLPAEVVMSLTYTGSRSTNLSTTKNLDALPNQYLSTLPTRDQATINYLTTNIANPYYHLVPSGSSLYSNTTISRSQLLTPYPQFTGVSLDTQQGYNRYNALQVDVQKRLAHGFTETFAFTWQNNMEATSFLNGGDAQPEKLPATTDMPINISLSSLYELPIGRGHKLLGNASRAVDFIFGGWQLQGVYRHQSGPPMGFGNALMNGACNGWADIALPKDRRTYQHWINTSCFNTNSSQQLSNNLITMPARFSYIRGMALDVLDLSGLKKFRLSERVSLEMRWEFLNATNHVWLGNPNTTPTNGAFGQCGTENSSPRRVYWSGRLRF